MASLGVLIPVENVFTALVCIPGDVSRKPAKEIVVQLVRAFVGAASGGKVGLPYRAP
jgi:hypothetical protein